MKPTDKRDVLEGVLIGVAIAFATAVFHGAIDEIRYQIDLRRKKKKGKK